MGSQVLPRVEEVPEHQALQLQERREGAQAQRLGDLPRRLQAVLP